MESERIEAVCNSWHLVTSSSLQANGELKAFHKFSWLVGIDAICRPLFGTCEWKQLAGKCGLKHFASFPGTCELKQFPGLCVALENWKQFCKLGTCELKQLVGFCLALVTLKKLKLMALVK